MIRLPRPRDLDPDLRRHHLPFYLRGRWILVQIAIAVAAQFSWALVMIQQEPLYYRPLLRLSVAVFVAATSFGYLFARVGSRFLGSSLVRIRLGKERLLDSSLGRATLGSGIAIVALPQVVNALIASELLFPIPFYSGAVVGMGFSFFLWAIGLPR